LMRGSSSTTTRLRQRVNRVLRLLSPTSWLTVGIAIWYCILILLIGLALSGSIDEHGADLETSALHRRDLELLENSNSNSGYSGYSGYLDPKVRHELAVDRARVL